MVTVEQRHELSVSSVSQHLIVTGHERIEVRRDWIDVAAVVGMASKAISKGVRLVGMNGEMRVLSGFQ